jgi:hypothetical protein
VVLLPLLLLLLLLLLLVSVGCCISFTCSACDIRPLLPSLAINVHF